MARSFASLLGIYIAALNFTLVYFLITLWPGVHVPPALLEHRYLLCAAAAGALGSYIHLATSFIEHAGRGKLDAGWGWWYVLRPWIGSALALVVYCVVRAGLVAGASDSATANINPYGVASISALSGMFSRQATEKLRDVFQNLCAVTPKTES